MRHRRMGYRQKGVSGTYSHVTPPMIAAMLDGLQRRWEQDGSTAAGDHYQDASVVKISCSQFAPTTQNGPLVMITNRPSDQHLCLVGDTGIEPVTPTVSRLGRQRLYLGIYGLAQAGRPCSVSLVRGMAGSIGLWPPEFLRSIMLSPLKQRHPTSVVSR
jgi:hypothetical protein